MTTSPSFAAAQGRQKAAQQILSISEKELQRIRQRGTSVATEGDRSLLRAPDYKAMPWPLASAPGNSVAGNPNDKYGDRSSINAEGFLAPYAGQEASHRASFSAPELGFSATGDLAQVDAVSFASHSPHGERSFQELVSEMVATGTVGGSQEKSFMEVSAYSNAALPGQGAAGRLGTPLDGSLPSKRQELLEAELFEDLGDDRDFVYGAENKKQADLRERLRLACLGALYDVCHFADITPELLQAEGCSSRAGYILTRQQRAQSLFLVFLVVVLISLLLWKFLA